MSQVLCITVRFLQPYSHGRGDGGEPEWPPSPMRLFQALVNAAAARWNERTRLAYAVPALEWLQRQAVSSIVAAVGVPSGTKYRLYVPDNVADKVAKSWRGGNPSASIADYRTEKDVRPTHLNGEAVHYLYPITDGEFEKHRQTIVAAARSITHLGWGVDMVAGDASVISEEQAASLPGERWQPTADGSGTRLRVPRVGTLQALIEKHAAFLGRLTADGFRPVPPLTAFDVVGYRRGTDVASRPFAAFELHRPIHELEALPAGRSRFRPFDPSRWMCAVAGMVRHATAAAAERAGRPVEWINTFVHGHTPDGTDRARGEAAEQRFMYVPLPSIEWRGDRGVHVGMIRRVLVVGPHGGKEQVDWARRALSGQELFAVDRTEPVAALTAIPNTEKNLNLYAGQDGAQVWSTVTPLILPGHDEAAPSVVDRRVRMAADAATRERVRAQAESRTQRLIRAALTQAGLPDELVARSEWQWRTVSYWPGVEPTGRYVVPDTFQRLPRYHVRIRFPVRVAGPLVIGAGRYRGFGIFAAEGR